MAAVVETRSGRLEGIHAGDLFVFRGIPYASAPVGAQRWLPPQPEAPWSGVRAAQAYANASCQNTAELATLPILTVEQEQGEDCLYLNVFTPGLDEAARPVMVWIHGGGFTIGAGSQFMGDAMPLAVRGDVVVVTINYRLGVLGFLNLNEVTGGAIPATGNEGLLDQIAALEWVRDNAAGFGGDPGNVTVFGESAGGMSVGSLLGAPAARGLFHRAIPQSGASSTAISLDRARRVAERVLELCGTRDPSVLRGLTAGQLLDAQKKLLPGVGVEPDPELGTMPLQPVVDGTVLPRLPIESVARGDAAGIPLLVGSTLEEWKLFSVANPALATLDDAGLRGQLRHLPDPDPVISGYRAAREKRGAGATPVDLLTAIETDRVFRMPAVRLAEAQRPHESRVFSYLVTWASPFFDGLLGACHAVELGPLFGLQDAGEQVAAFFGSGPDADRLSVQMQEAWTAFARGGEPSCTSLGAWSAYEPDRRATMLRGAESPLENAPYDDERRIWDAVPSDVLGTM